MAKVSTGEAVAWVTLSAASWLSHGVVTEIHTNDVADGKTITATACADTYGTEGVVTEDVINCMQYGWIPGGRKIDTSEFHPNTPIGLVDGYVQVQQYEAAHIEKDRLVIWAALGGVLMSLLIAWENRRARWQSTSVASTDSQLPTPDPEPRTVFYDFGTEIPVEE